MYSILCTVCMMYACKSHIVGGDSVSVITITVHVKKIMLSIRVNSSDVIVHVLFKKKSYMYTCRTIGSRQEKEIVLVQ